MININKYLQKIRPYKVASHKVWRVAPSERDTLLKLDWNEATCETSPVVKERLHRLLETQFLNLYPDTNNDELYSQLSKYVDLPKDNIQYFGSSDSLHEYISRLYIGVGDEVLILWPSYDNLRLTLQASGANINFFELNDDFSFNTDEFERKIIELHPKLVYICNPNNPTGTIIDKEYIKYLIKKYKDIIFLIDEAYIEFCILITRTLSKAFGLSNVRFGYMLASKDNIDAISTIRNPKNITTFAQEAAIGALSDIQYMDTYVEQIKKARSYFINIINTQYDRYLKTYSSYGNFVLIDCYDYQTKVELLKYLENHNIFIRAVNQSESLKNCVRITIGTKSQMRAVIDTIDSFFKKKNI